MASNKVYETLKGAVVAPSKVESIEFNSVNENRYRVRHCMGKIGNAIRYSTNSTLITFMGKNADGKTTEGLQIEQLALIMRDYLLKQENPDEKKIEALNVFLDQEEETTEEATE